MSVSAADRHLSTGPVLEQYLEPGFNFRMTDIQAAVGLVQLGRLDDVIDRRRALARRYQQALDGVAGLRTISDTLEGTTNFQSFWILLPDDAAIDRDELLLQLSEAGISGRRGIMAAHLEPAYASHPRVPLPVTERLTRQSLILPLFHEMSDDDQDRVIASVLAGVAVPSDRGRVA
jgi:perosamine synthetase